jgi:hypothetical protein
MNKTELDKLLGRYVDIIYTLYSKKHKTTAFFHLPGFIMAVEEKNILFKDNYNHEFIVPIARIKSVCLEEARRTEEEAKKLPVIKPKKDKKPKEIDNEPPLMMVDYSTGAPVLKPIVNETI